MFFGKSNVFGMTELVVEENLKNLTNENFYNKMFLSHQICLKITNSNDCNDNKIIRMEATTRVKDKYANHTENF